MKSFVCVLVLAALVAAEPPRYRQSRQRFAREEGEESGDERESYKSERVGAPYPSSGHKPHKEFRLPSRQELAPPATSYGIPEESYRAPLYVAPIVQYGLPKSRSYQGKAGEEEESESASVESGEGESEEDDSDEEDSKGKGERKEKSEKKEKGEKREKWEKKERGEKKRKGEKKEKENLEEESDDDDIVSSHGAYYVLLPSSELQRVQFQTENDLSKMAYTARLQYRNEGRAPVYVYTAVPQYQSPAAAYTSVVPSYQPSAAFSAYSVQQQW